MYFNGTEIVIEKNIPLLRVRVQDVFFFFFLRIEVFIKNKVKCEEFIRVMRI